MSDAVLDSSAVLAMLLDEPGGDVVESLLAKGGCAISSVNAAEVATRFVERGATRTEVTRIIDRLEADVVSFDKGQAVEAGLLRAHTRDAGLSLGDRAALVLARSLDVPVYTSDSAWLRVDVGVEVRHIRPNATNI